MQLPIGIVTGLQMEADVARGLPGARVACLGPGPLKALQAAQSLIEGGVAALVSFGIAGGLDPALKAGDTVISTDLAAKLGNLPGCIAGEIATLTDPALTPEDKAALYASSQCAAVDMETSAIRDAARGAGLPFGHIRAICDTAADTIPPLALKGMAPDGTVKPVRVAAGLLTRPQDLSALLHLGKQQKKAMAALHEIVLRQPNIAAMLTGG